MCRSGADYLRRDAPGFFLARFVAAENVTLFGTKLEMETDAEKRRVLEVLLAEEQAKLAALAQSAHAVGA